MATRNGADGPSNLKSSENLIGVSALAGPAARTAAKAAASIRPASRRRIFLINFMSLPLVSLAFWLLARRPLDRRPARSCSIAAQQRTCRLKEQGRTLSQAAGRMLCTRDCHTAVVAGTWLWRLLLN